MKLYIIEPKDYNQHNATNVLKVIQLNTMENTEENMKFVFSSFLNKESFSVMIDILSVINPQNKKKTLFMNNSKLVRYGSNHKIYLSMNVFSLMHYYFQCVRHCVVDRI